MKTLRNAALATLGLIWFAGMDCGARPQDLNLRYTVKNMGGSIDLMWDGAEDVIDYLLYKDDSLIDTLPPESLHYVFDSTMIGKTFRVVAEGTRLEGNLDLTPYVDSFTLYEKDYSDTTPCAVSFDGNGHYRLYGMGTDTLNWWYAIQVVLADTFKDSVDLASIRLVSASLFGMNYVAAFTVNTQDYAPTPNPDDSLFAYNYSAFITASEYAAWLWAPDYKWSTGSNFARLTITNIDPAGAVSFRYAYQTGPGLRWFPY
ncbi:MAG: hypothetical protein ACP5QG_09550 [candidate division WOR-3 bacterium]